MGYLESHMGYDDEVRIKRLSNGYTIRLRDPKIVKANQKRDRSSSGAPYAPYKDPEREFAFTDIDKVLAWLKANLDKALPEDDFDSAFSTAVEDDDDDGE